MSDSNAVRPDGRGPEDLRAVVVETGFQRNPEGSVLYRCGGTTVLVAASVAEGVPPFMQNARGGWLTAEYAMHPRASARRQRRDGRGGGGIDGRSAEIQRLIGRSLRAAVRLDQIGPRTITVDCDVLESDGGTRTASVTAGYIGVALALDALRKRALLGGGVLREPVAAVSVGWAAGRALLDVCYEEDRDAEMDLNVVGTRSGAIIEVQGTAEASPIPRERFDAMLSLGLGSMPALMARQRTALERAGVDLDALLRT
ncbi:MAG: ribonuclease PH [Sandaracinaceae bacterium]|nr:ribonuclease PH [Sandaracinaceae bacterium]